MLRGIGLKVAATCAFAVMSALIKLASPRFPVDELVFFRSLFALLTLVVWLARRGEFPRALHTQRPFGHVGRSLAGSGGMFASFVALSLLPLADATAFTFATPLMVVALAALVLGEEVRPARGAAVVVGFLGVLIMLSDHLGDGFAGVSGTTGAGAGAIVALAGAVSSAVAMIQTRRLTQSEPTGAIVFYFTVLTAVISGAMLLLAAVWPSGGFGGAIARSQQWTTPSGPEFALLAAIGLLGGCGQILMTHSYRFADASIIAAFDYATMLWASMLGYSLFGEAPSGRILLGAAVVVVAGVFMLWRERELRRIRVAEVGESPS